MENSFNFELSSGERLELVKTLVNSTSNLNHQDFEGNTALHYAAYFQFSELVKVLAEKCDVQIRNRSKYK